MTAWMLAQLKPGADAIAERNLRRQGFLTFQPLERQAVFHNGRFRTRIRPFFPGYMFVNYPAARAPWSFINSTHGVARLVKFGDRPAPVPTHVIGELRAACDLEGFMTLTSRLDVSSDVEIPSGSFSNFIGRIERLSPNDRAHVLIDLMGRKTRVDLACANLRVVSAQTSHARRS